MTGMPHTPTPSTPSTDNPLTPPRYAYQSTQPLNLNIRTSNDIAILNSMVIREPERVPAQRGQGAGGVGGR